MRWHADGRLAAPRVLLVLTGMSLVCTEASAGHHNRGQAVQAVPVASVATVPVQTQVQTQYVTATPIVTTRAPLFRRRTQAVLVNAAAAPATTYVVGSAPVQTVTAASVVAAPTTVTWTLQPLTITQNAAPTFSTQQVGAVATGQTVVRTAVSANQQLAASLTQGLVAESVAASEAPYLTTLVDASGRGTIAGLIKAALRNFLQLLGPGAQNGSLLKQIASILLDFFVGGTPIDRNSASRDIDNIINSLLNGGQQGGGGGNGSTLPPGQYAIQGTFSGTITVGPSGGGGGTGPLPPPPVPNNSGASDPSDRDPQGASTSPF